MNFLLSSNLYTKIIFFFLLLLVGRFAMAQKSKRIEILNANSIEFDEKIGKDIKRLLGDVQFKHDNAIMFCDSAYLNSKTNYLQAFNNVHIIQGDSLDLYGDYLNYNGNTKLAKVRRNVRLVHGKSTLKTDSLDYNRVNNIAHYFSWGYIKDQKNDLKSINGYYYSDYKDYYAVDSVTLVNPEYKIFSDTLRYNTGSDITYFYGKTNIVSDSNLIYCENGWYDTKKNLSRFSKNAYLLTKEKKLSGDSLFFNRNINFGEAFGNVAILDTAAKIVVTGNYGNYYQNPDRAFVTDRALLTNYGKGDSLFLHADTLKMLSFTDSVPYSILKKRYIYTDTLTHKIDTLSEHESAHVEDLKPNVYKTELLDTIWHFRLDTFKLISAYHHAQIFKSDLQTRCDSLCYSTKDSIIRFFGQPIIWSNDQQISSEYIELLTEDNNPKEMFIDQSAFIAIKDDSIRFNQIQGVSMRAYFNKEKQLHKLFVVKQASSIFFPREDATEEQKEYNEKGELVGANVTESNQMMIWFKDNQPYKITLYTNPTGVLNPINYKPIEELKLKGFDWKVHLQPKSLNDIFEWKE